VLSRQWLAVRRKFGYKTFHHSRFLQDISTAWHCLNLK